ncbi:hypothetical protein LCGC14_0955480 [marine sediment metagenome]|uniref:Uncharacterized protein n=1 Tax=marine sediment metagenome TaxID=412755 RepID=A0A0F9RMF6_9ZZZZ|nr:hypothetical protein [Methylophaga sp.]
MKKLIIVLFLLTSLIESKPIHHRINDWFHDEGYVDRWSWSHAQTGTIKGIIAEVGYGYATRHGYDYPSAAKLLWYNFCLAFLFEVGEFGVEGDFNWDKYQDMYNGKALQNNGMDIFLDMFAFSVPLWDDLYYEFKILKHEGFSLQLQWSLS